MNLISLDYSKLDSFINENEVTLEKTADGKIKMLNLPAGISAEDFKWNNSPSDSSPSAVLKDFEAKVTPVQNVMDKWNLHKVLEPYLPKDIYPAVYMSKQEIDELNVSLTDIGPYVEKQQAKWIMDGGIENDWAKYIDQLDKMRLGDLMKIYKQAYERYNK